MARVRVNVLKSHGRFISAASFRLKLGKREREGGEVKRCKTMAFDREQGFAEGKF